MTVLSAIEKVAGRFVDDAYRTAGALVRHVKPSEIKSAEELMVLVDKIAQTKLSGVSHVIEKIGISEKITKGLNIFDKIPDLPDGVSLPLNADTVFQMGKILKGSLEGASTAVRLVEGNIKTIAAQRHIDFETFSASENAILNGDIAQYIKELEKRMKDYNKEYKLIFNGEMPVHRLRNLSVKEEFTDAFNFLKQKVSKIYENLTTNNTCLDPSFA